MRCVSLLFFCFWACYSYPEVKAQQHVLEEAGILKLLRGYEWNLDEAAFELLPTNTWKHLLRIASDNRFRKVTRSRAEVALTLYPNEEVWLHMKSQLNSDISEPAGKLATRRRMVEQLCRTFALRRPRLVELELIPLLEESDPHLRVVAARCLQKFSAESSMKALSRYRTRLLDNNTSNQWELDAMGAEVNFSGAAKQDSRLRRLR